MINKFYDELIDFVTLYFSEMHFGIYSVKTPFSWDDDYDHSLRASILVHEQYEQMKTVFPKYFNNQIKGRKSIFMLQDIYNCNYIIIPLISGNEYLFIGPYLTRPASVDYVSAFMAEHKIVQGYKTYLTQYYSTLPFVKNVSELELFLRSLSIKLWNSPELVYIDNHEKEYIMSNGEIVSPKEIEFPEKMDLLENRYEQEDLGMNYIAKGDYKNAINIFLSPFFRNLDQRTNSSLRSIKNYIIIANTLFRKSAQKGGVHPIYLDDLSRKMSLRIESMTSPEESREVVLEMIHKYCNLVNNFAISGHSPAISSVITYINSNLNTKLTLSLIADKFNINKSYLSTRFKAETGDNITDYIRHKRLEQAIFYLENTTYSIQDIAFKCGVYDLAYFTKLFHEEVGITPSDYRKKAISTKE